MKYFLDKYIGFKDSLLGLMMWDDSRFDWALRSDIRHWLNGHDVEDAVIQFNGSSTMLHGRNAWVIDLPEDIGLMFKLTWGGNA